MTADQWEAALRVALLGLIFVLAVAFSWWLAGFGNHDDNEV